MGAEGLAKSSHLDFHAIDDSRAVGDSPPRFAKNPDGVRFVKQEPGTEPLLQRDDIRYRCDVAIHAVNRLGHDKNTRGGVFFRSPAQVAFEFAEVVVGKDTDGRATQSSPVDQTGMREFVEDHHILGSAEGGNDPECRRIAARE